VSTLTQKNRTLPEHRSNQTGAPPGTHPTLARYLIASLPSRVLNIVKLLRKTLSKALLKVFCGCCSSCCVPFLLFCAGIVQPAYNTLAVRPLPGPSNRKSFHDDTEATEGDTVESDALFKTDDVTDHEREIKSPFHNQYMVSTLRHP
jgi:hypothetical protein